MKDEFTKNSVIIVGNGADGQMLEIVPDGKGGYKVVPIPMPGPERERAAELGLLLRALTAVGSIKQAEAQPALVALAKLAHGAIDTLTGELNRPGSTVFIVTS